jgi:uncharacterized cupin superfamily protein
LETSNAPGFGPPLHRHGETEVFRVLEGRYLFEVNGQRFEAAAGDLVSVPGGDADAFINITDKPARQLVMMLPGMDAQRFFFEVGQILEKESPDRNALNAFGEPQGVEFLGPRFYRKPARIAIAQIRHRSLSSQVRMPPSRGY